MDNLLEIKNLDIQFNTAEGVVHAVKNVSFNIPQGKTVGLVGESGSGKSVTSLAAMGLLTSPPAKINSGEILFAGKDLLKLSEAEMRSYRGNHLSMIFQEPMTSLNPVFTVGYQIAESIILHKKKSKAEAWEMAVDLLDKVGIPSPRQRVKSYPHEMSGGQRQRVMIAMAIACEPDLLIADEPTTALDVTIQKQILELLADLQSQYNMSMLFITHDLAVISDIADDVAVMYRGELVERGNSQTLFKSAQHPYTKGLLACRPSMDESHARLATIDRFMTKDGKAKTFRVEDLGIKSRPKIEANEKPILTIRGLKKHFPVKGGFFGTTKNWIKAVDGVDLDVYKGRTLGLVGESGCGKTTLGRTILRLIEPSEGQIEFKGKKITGLGKEQMRALRRKMQIIFQDPYASLNPRMTIGSAVTEPMVIHRLYENKNERWQRAQELMEKVGLEAKHLNRYPHEFSGGQRQRICIARSLAVEPEFIICDESVSALDVSIQAQILNLLLDLQQELGLTYIFISHDLAVVKFISDELAVMNQGKVVEMANAEEIYKSPQSEYTKKLLASIPGQNMQV